MPTADKDDRIRSFVCVEVPRRIQERILAVQDELRKTGARVSWVRHSNIHLTIRFLGDLRASRVHQVTQAIEKSVVGTAPFELEAGGTGCFPSSRNPRILWVGLTLVPESLSRIRNTLEDELARIGFERESKKFSPHLTMGRIRSTDGAQQLSERLLSIGFEPERFPVNAVVLMRSDLKPTGSIYQPQASITLQG